MLNLMLLASVIITKIRCCPTSEIFEDEARRKESIIGYHNVHTLFFHKQSLIYIAIKGNVHEFSLRLLLYLSIGTLRARVNSTCKPKLTKERR